MDLHEQHDPDLTDDTIELPIPWGVKALETVWPPTDTPQPFLRLTLGDMDLGEWRIEEITVRTQGRFSLPQCLATLRRVDRR